ncbi:MAG TPA: CPXCG motif-containing cysteine-rich protein, partial [Gammaproteobacteria bacterium]|nr:CPXCG motif-containing cysteine-rich protein [Gammaproteobacteria bacterium]
MCEAAAQRNTWPFRSIPVFSLDEFKARRNSLRKKYVAPCGELFVILIDLLPGASQHTEGCEICCRPIQFQVECTNSDELASRAFWR